jgi:hypothetical protein
MRQLSLFKLPPYTVAEFDRLQYNLLWKPKGCARERWAKKIAKWPARDRRRLLNKDTPTWIHFNTKTINMFEKEDRFEREIAMMQRKIESYV